MAELITVNWFIYSLLPSRKNTLEINLNKSDVSNRTSEFPATFTTEQKRTIISG